MNAADINKMSVDERVQIMELIWDSFQNGSTELQPPKWHKSILEEREEKIKNKSASFLSIDTLKERRR